ARDGGLAPFQNEPPTDFTRHEHRTAFRAALASVAAELGRSYPIVLKGERIETGETFASLDPGDRSRVVGTFSRATQAEAVRALAIARSAFDGWSNTPAHDRAGVLVQAAAILRRRKFELAAWEVYECGKPWREADADIAEAIDLCEFYAREMIRLATP